MSCHCIMSEGDLIQCGECQAASHTRRDGYKAGYAAAVAEIVKWIREDLVQNRGAQLLANDIEGGAYKK